MGAFLRAPPDEATAVAAAARCGLCSAPRGIAGTGFEPQTAGYVRAGCRVRELARGRMRAFVAFLTMLEGILAAVPPAAAQRAGASLSAEARDIGRLETRIQKYDQALGVVTRLIRAPDAETECQGTCFLPSSSRSVSWRCSPNSGCALHCEVNPPVGGCR
jgi:hypothetical protein